MKTSESTRTEGRSPLATHLLHSARNDRVPPGAMKRAMTRAGIGMSVLTLVQSAAAQTLTRGAIAKALVLFALGTTTVAVVSSAGVGRTETPYRALALQPIIAMPSSWLGATAPTKPAADVRTSELQEKPDTLHAEHTLVTPAPLRSVTPPRTPSPLGSAAEVGVTAMSTHDAITSSLPATQPSTESPSTDIAREAAALSGVRQAIAGGALADARSALGKYDGLAVRKQLTTEADVLRIELEKASGNAARAKSLARVFLAAHPSGPLAERVARLVREP